MSVESAIPSIERFSASGATLVRMTRFAGAKA
jgi:hypothetical protein